MRPTMTLGYVVGLDMSDIDTVGSRSCCMMCIVDTDHQVLAVPQMQGHKADCKIEYLDVPSPKMSALRINFKEQEGFRYRTEARWELRDIECRGEEGGDSECDIVSGLRFPLLHD